ncbi:hypothetical protein Zmor_011033 [Zophobas morio]|uniref:Uncharacterized protein n=1 Tax=Zophobas morio TaxID=2755281 RepID=A0AA38IPZ1_9CUCU|nr:hypothetical protein Zmor_011033 [Zophobas morio]
MRRFRHGLPPTGTQKPRRKNGEKSGTPNGSTGAATFSNGTDQHWKNKTQQQKAQNNSQLKIQPVARSARKEVDRSLQAIKAKWVILHETKTP